MLSSGQDATKGEIDAFTSKTNAIATIDKATNSLNFLRFPIGRAYKIDAGDVQQKSNVFLSENSKLFALRPNEDVFRFKEQKTDNYGLDNVTLQQTYKGVPVYDGLMKFHYNTNKDLTSVNGNFISGIKVNVVPTLAQNEAEAAAIKYVKGGKLEELAIPLRVNKSALYIFQKGLVQGYNGPKLLVYEVEVRNDVNIREFLYINAHDGTLVEQFSGIHSIDRELYETSYTPANLKWKEGDPFPAALDQWQQSEIQSAGFIYNLMKNAFGYVSYNGADAKMVTVNNDPQIACPNANWNGVTANYCTGTATDDVVAHEWGHAYTEYTSGLVYAWQSGAMNEAYSDIWGETVDQLDGYMDEGENNSTRTDCGSSARWAVGEKATSFGGAIRDMWNPNCYGDPGKVSDSQYWCSSGDNGGVHINSGVLNHAYALLVDGGTYNGQTIAGIGLTKAAHVFWRAQTTYMTSTTDFAAQADFLVASMADLIESGVNLQGLSTTTTAAGASGQIMTASDLQQLEKVLLAVELRADNSCGFQPLLKPVAALCEGANAGLALFYENFESGLNGFITSAATASGSWFVRNWELKPAPGGRSGNVAFGVDYQGGNCTSSIQAGIIRLESPLITIPAETAGNINMAFDHYVATEETWDGGNIKYSINGEAWTLLPQSAFTANGYNNVLNTAAAGNDNPLQGQRAFSGADGGTVTGSWGQSQIDLTSIGLVPGSTIKFRWEMGTDGCNGIDGWYVDDIRVYTCAVTPAVHFALENAAINEGEGAANGTDCLGYVDKTFMVRIDKAPTQPVTVTFNAPGGTAKMGPTADYTISPASVTLQAGALMQNITVRVYNDAYIEGEETIDLSYTINTNGGNGYAASSFQQLSLTITDDDLAPGNYTEDLLVSGFNNGAGGWQVKNGGNNFNTWVLSSFSNAALDPAGRPFFFVRSDNVAGGFGIISNEIIESPAINSAGKKNMVLTFAQDWNPYDGDYAEQGIVEVWDGTTWHAVLTQPETTGRLGSIFTTPNIQTINIPDEYANVNMKIRFRYLANWDGWWAVDNVKLTSSNSTSILSSVNSSTPARQYLGPNETAIFYDPATGNLIAKIKNLTEFDYGCTTVEVDRAGVDAVNWLGDYHITRKTFKVIPTNNNAKGNFEITLYYKASELPGFKSEIKSIAKTDGAIEGTSVVAFQPSTAFESDYAFTGTFKSGFSGFALSDAPPSPLPVTLAKFDGKHTAEGNLLNWTTTSEVNNEYFAVEKAVNGKNFAEIGRVAGNRNSAVTNDYKFTDMNYQKGISYYRLKQVDTDGTFAYSKIISIDALNTRELKFFPNPIQSTLTMELPDVDMKLVNVKIINTAGQTMLSQEKLKVINGNLNMDLGKLPTGIYQLILSGETSIGTKSDYKASIFKL